MKIVKLFDLMKTGRKLNFKVDHRNLEKKRGFDDSQLFSWVLVFETSISIIILTKTW